MIIIESHSYAIADYCHGLAHLRKISRDFVEKKNPRNFQGSSNDKR
jgi:hypothetical protein